MNIGVIQIYTADIKEYAEYGRLINAQYAISHGYEYVCWEYSLVPLERSVYYNKILAMLAAFDSDLQFDWILYLDADAVVTKPSVQIEDIIAQYPNREIILGLDMNGVDNGVILIKNTPNMKQLLLDCYNDSRFFHTKTPEQSAMLMLLQEERYNEFIGWIQADFFDAYLCYYKDMKYPTPLWGDQSFVLHLQQVSKKQRSLIFRQLLQLMHIRCLIKEDE